MYHKHGKINHLKICYWKFLFSSQYLLKNDYNDCEKEVTQLRMWQFPPYMCVIVQFFITSCIISDTCQ